MRSLTLAALATVLFALPAEATTTRWELDAGHSELGFRVRHMMVSWTRGKFDAFKGSLELDDKNPSASKVTVDIEAASINTNLAKRDEHLRSADFFDVARFPAVTFRSTRVESKGGGLAITGDLTLHGVTRSVTLQADALPKPVLDPWGSLRIGTRATAQLERRDFGLVWNAALEAGGVVVGDAVELTLDVEFVRPAEKSARK